MEDLRIAMDRQLKGTVVPLLREAGFAGSFPYFRRRRAEAIDLLTFQLIEAVAASLSKKWVPFSGAK